MNYQLHNGNCLDVLKTLEANSVDAIVTDPPYEIAVLGKNWDATGIAYNVEMWAECLRVLKVGGHLLAFGAARTYHRMACAIEDAGFEIRDSIHWTYGSGFPKSLDISKAIDKQRHDRNDVLKVTKWVRETRDAKGLKNSDIDGAFGFAGMAGHWTTDKTQPTVPTLEQVPKLLEVLGVDLDELPAEIKQLLWELNGRKGQLGENWLKREITGVHETAPAVQNWKANYGNEANLQAKEKRDKPASGNAQKWQGWGTALKPAHEPIVVARKPIPTTTTTNVLQYGTGALNIDGCRVPSENNAEGRWPSNFVLSHSTQCGEHCAQDCPVAEINRQAASKSENVARFFPILEWDETAPPFQYVAKPKSKERNAGLEHIEPRFAPTMGAGIGAKEHTPETATPKNNFHPTVKPLALMRWLVRLVTPPDGTVLDPFAGSGTTMAAALLEEKNTIGIELTADYLPIIEGRCEWAKQEIENKPKEQTLFEF